MIRMATFDTKEAVAELAKTDPEFAEFLAKHPDTPKPPFDAGVPEFRKNPPPAPPTTDIEYTRTIPMRDGHVSEIRIYRPDNSSAARPMFVIIHGGGFCVGSNHAPGFRSRPIAAANEITVVSLSYRLAPEHRFPTAPNDIWDAMEWLSRPENAKEIGCDLSLGFYIGGISAGGNLSAVTAQRWVSEKKTPELRGVWLSIPYLLEEEIVPAEYKDLFISRDQSSDTLVIDRAATEFVREAYRPDVKSPALSPFNAEKPHTGMPPVYFQIAGQDPLRDDGLIYERALRVHGVSTRLDVYPGLPHAFDGSFRHLKVSQKAMVDMLKGIGWLMGKEVDEQRCEQLIKETHTVPLSGPPL